MYTTYYLHIGNMIHVFISLLHVFSGSNIIGAKCCINLSSMLLIYFVRKFISTTNVEHISSNAYGSIIYTLSIFITITVVPAFQRLKSHNLNFVICNIHCSNYDSSKIKIHSNKRGVRLGKL